MPDQPPTHIEGPLEEERKGRGRRAEDPKRASPTRAWQGSLAQRVRVAREMPQAVLKVSSHNSGKASVRKRLHYISRKGMLSIETDDGTTLDGLAEIDQYVDSWAADFSVRQRSAGVPIEKRRVPRDAMSLVVSLPADTDHETALQAAREFFADAFGANHEYAFAAHDDTDHFHIHLVVKSRGRDGRQMRPSRRHPDLWRQGFAAKAREHGIALDASPRWARGKGRRCPPTPVYEIRRRGETPRVDREAAKDALQRVRDPQDRPTPHEQAIRAINQRERIEFATQAKLTAQLAKKIGNDGERMKVIEIAADLASYAEGMPVPRSRMDTLKSAVAPAAKPRAKPGQDQVRVLVKQTERMLREQVPTFEPPELRRRAVAARARLSDILTDQNRGRSRGHDAVR